MASDSLAAPVKGASQVTVTAVDIDFEPARMDVVLGEPVNVTVVNEGGTLHDFTIDEPGTYEAKCTVAGHAEAGMTVDVVVGDAS